MVDLPGDADTGPRNAVRAHLIVAVLGIFFVLRASHAALPAPWWSTGPFVFQDPGQASLLLVRCGVLFFALCVLRDTPARATMVVVLFLTSLALRDFLVPFLVIVIGLVARAGAVDRAAAIVLHASLVGALVVATAALLHRPPPVPDPHDPQAMEAYWRARKNPYQARSWALAWSLQEGSAPGDGYLELATIDWELGRDVQARKVLDKILSRSSSARAISRASALRDTWERERPSKP
jgi:hypothetical protein